MKAPLWFCCGRLSPWCVIDTIMHDLLRRDWRWVCDKHDDQITR